MRQVQQSIGEPYLAYKSGYADQHHLLPCKGSSDGEAGRLLASLKMYDRTPRPNHLPLGGNRGRAQLVQRNIEMAGKSFGSAAAIRHIVVERRKKSARPDHWVEQPAGGNAVAKFQTVGDDALHPKMLSQRNHDVIQRLANQNHICPGLHQFPYLLRAPALEVRFQFVLEVFLAEQIEPIPGHPAKDGVHHPGSKLAVGRVENRAKNSHQEDQPAATEASCKCLRIPRKESHRPDHGQVQQATFYAPVHRRIGIMVRLIQNCGSSL